MLKICETLVDGCLGGCYILALVPRRILSKRTVCMTMALYSKTQDPETVVSYCLIFDSGLVFENVVDWLSHQADEGVELRCGNKYAAQLKP